MAMLRTVNRWAIVDYLRAWGKSKGDEIFVKIADAIDTDTRPKGLSDSEEMLLEELINSVSEYRMHQSLCLDVVDALRKNTWSTETIITFVTCLMLDTTVRDHEWERQHEEWNKPSNKGEFRVDYMSTNPKEPDYLQPHRIL